MNECLTKTVISSMGTEVGTARAQETIAGFLLTLCADMTVHIFTHDDLRVGDVSCLTNNDSWIGIFEMSPCFLH